MKQVPRRRTRTVRSSAFLDLKHRARVARERHVRTFDSQNTHNFCYLERLLRVMFLIFVARGEVPLCQKKKRASPREQRESASIRFPTSLPLFSPSCERFSLFFLAQASALFFLSCTFFIVCVTSVSHLLPLSLSLTLEARARATQRARAIV